MFDFEGLKWAILMGCKDLIVESDCIWAVNFIKKNVGLWSDVEALVNSIWSLLPNFSCIQFEYIQLGKLDCQICMTVS